MRVVLHYYKWYYMVNVYRENKSGLQLTRRKELKIKMKALIMVVILLLTQAIPVFADNTGAIQTEIQNEYDYLVRLISTSEKELYNQGYSKGEILAIKEINLDELIIKQLERVDETIKELENSDGSKDRIATLKNLRSKYGNRTSLSRTTFAKSMDVSSNIDSTRLSAYETRALFGSLTLSHQIVSHSYISSQDKTRAQIRFEWTWDSRPIIMEEDIVALSWVGAFSYDVGYHTVEFRQSDGTLEKSKSVPIQGYKVRSCKSTFDLTEPYQAGYAKKGTGLVSISQAGLERNLQVQFGYGHSTLFFTPSISLSGAGFSFSKGVTDHFAPIQKSEI